MRETFYETPRGTSGSNERLCTRIYLHLKTHYNDSKGVLKAMDGPARNKKNKKKIKRGESSVKERFQQIPGA